MNAKKLLIILATCLSGTMAQAKQPDLRGAIPSGVLHFVENKGQVKDQHQGPRQDIDFGISNNGLSLFIGQGQLHYQFAEITNGAELKKFDEERSSKPVPGQESEKKHAPHARINAYRIDVELVGANTAARVTKEGKANYYERYFVPGCEGGEVANAYQKLVYTDIYPNIDWVIYTKGEVVEYEFVVRPGGKPSDIKLKYAGAGSMAIQADGSLKVTSPMGDIKENAPYSYQQDGKLVASSFNLTGDVLTFNVGQYEGTLVIDPTLSWATYYGGGSSYEYGWGSMVSPSGMTYMTGYTSGASNLATTGTFQTSLQSSYDAYLVKFNNSGVRQWGTYYGGSSDEYDTRLYAGANAVYMTGYTYSSNVIASSGAHQTSKSSSYDAFLVKFDTTGNREWGTYYGGNSDDYGYDVVADAAGDVYMCGNTNSSSNIASGGHQNSMGNTSYTDAFLVKFNSSGTRLWATYYGGTYYDYGYNLAIDRTSGDVYMSGSTYSTNNIATSGAHQTTHYNQSCTQCYIAPYLVKFNSSGTRLWGTYYAGLYSSYNYGHDIAVDPSGNVVMVGYCGNSTGNTAVATSGTHQPSAVSSDEGFVVKFNSSGTRQWGTWYGGPSDEQAYAVTTDQLGNIYIGGSTNSSSGIASTIGAIQSTLSSGPDCFIAKLNSSGARIWGTYYGGGGSDQIQQGGLSYDSLTYSLYASGYTYSSGLGTTGTHQSTHSSTSYSDALLIRIDDCPIPAQPGTITGASVVCEGTSQVYSVSPVSGATSYTWTFPTGWTGTSTSNTITVTTGSGSGTISVTANVVCGSSTPATMAVTSNPSPLATVTAAGPTTFCMGNSVVLNANAGTGYTYQWKLNGTDIPNETSTAFTATASGSYTVVVTNTTGCAQTATAVAVTVNPLPASTITASGPTSFCQGQNVILNANTGGMITYDWRMNGTTTGQTGSVYSATASAIYTLVVTDQNSCSNTSAPLTVTAHALPTATASIATSPLCAGQATSVNFSGTANAIVSYNINGGGSQFIALDGTGAATVNTAILTANTTYTIVSALSQEGCFQALSTSAIASVSPRPTASVTGTSNVCAGNSANITIDLTGTGPWDITYSDGTNLTSVTTSTDPYTFAVSPSSTTTYTLISLDDANCTASGIDMTGAATLTVNQNTVITSQPAGLTACSGSNAVLTVGATGSGLSYQWRRNGNAISNSFVYSGATAATLNIGDVSGVGGSFDVVITGTCGTPLTSNAVTITENTNNQWTGGVNNLWSVPGNWSCGSLPTINTNVTIPYTAVNMPQIDIPTAVCNNLSIDYGASVVFINSGNMLEVRSDITANGSFDATLGGVILSGSSNQLIPGVSYKEIRVLGGSNKTITGPATIVSDLELVSGHLVIGNHDLSFSSGATVTGGSNASFVVTNGTGVVTGLNMGIGGNTSAVLFPIGSDLTTYSPVRITNIGTTDNISVRVINGLYNNYNGEVPVGLPLSTKVVDKTWLITEAVPGGSNAIVTPQWNALSELGTFDRNSCYVAHYDTTSNVWESGAIGVASGSNPYWNSMVVNSFSPFGVASATSALALDLLSFTGTKMAEDAVLNWITVNESQVNAYQLERSEDAATFKAVHSASATGNGGSGENKYTYTDRNISKLSEKIFYRLKMIDNNGKFKYSNIVVINNSDENEVLANNTVVFPNPVEGSQVFIRNSDLLLHDLAVSVVDITGRVLSVTPVKAGQYTDMIPVDMEGLAPGVYTINIISNIGTTAVKVNKQ
jgi:hypothetical protein